MNIPCPRVGHLLVRFYGCEGHRGSLAWLPPDAVTPMTQEEIEGAIGEAGAHVQRDHTMHMDNADQVRKGKAKAQHQWESSKAGSAEKQAIYSHSVKQAHYQRALVEACADVPHAITTLSDAGAATSTHAPVGSLSMLSSGRLRKTSVRYGEDSDAQPLRVLPLVAPMACDPIFNQTAVEPDTLIKTVDHANWDHTDSDDTDSDDTDLDDADSVDGALPPPKVLKSARVTARISLAIAEAKVEARIRAEAKLDAKRIRKAAKLEAEPALSIVDL